MRRFNGRGLHARLNGHVVCLRDVAIERGINPGIVMKRYALLEHPDEIDDSLFAPPKARSLGKALTLMPDGTRHGVCELANMFNICQSRLTKHVVSGQRVFTREELELMQRKPREKDGDGFDSYKLQPIVLPEKITEGDMKPFRALANAVVALAFEDLVPACHRNGASRETAQASAAQAVSSAHRFLSGESDSDRLGLWCALSGNPVWKVKAAVKDKEEIVRKMRSILESTGRGKKQKKRAATPGARENLMIGGA